MTRNLTDRLTTGTVIVGVGILLLLATTGLVEMRSIWGWIALLFVLVGVWSLVRSEFRNLVGPVMVIAIAGTFFLRNVGIVPDGIIGTWWPIFVILFGVLVMVSRSRRRQRIQLEGVGGLGEVSVVSVFGSDDRRISTDRFAGAEVVAVFGDARLDLTDSGLGTTPAIVEVTAAFGDAEIRVPRDWNVRMETMSIFGSVRDRRPDRDEAEPVDSEPDAIITGVALFADIELRD